MTLRFTAADALDPPRPGGRWHKVLRALDRGPSALGLLVDLTDDGRFPRRRLSQKVRRALRDMRSIGLVRFTPDGWTRTDRGADVRRDLDRQLAAPEDRSCADAA